MKAQEQSQASNQQEDDVRGVDDLDDDNELAEENDDGLQMDPSEKAAISNSVHHPQHQLCSPYLSRVD